MDTETNFFCNLALFGFFSHIYAPGSFISKNGPLARRRHHWRRGSVCRRQSYWRLYVRRRCDLDLRGTYLGAIDLGAEVGARSTTPTSAPKSMAPRYVPINSTLRLACCCAHFNSSKLEMSRRGKYAKQR